MRARVSAYLTLHRYPESSRPAFPDRAGKVSLGAWAAVAVDRKRTAAESPNPALDDAPMDQLLFRNIKSTPGTRAPDRVKSVNAVIVATDQIGKFSRFQGGNRR